MAKEKFDNKFTLLFCQFCHLVEYISKSIIIDEIKAVIKQPRITLLVIAPI